MQLPYLQKPEKLRTIFSSLVTFIKNPRPILLLVCLLSSGYFFHTQTKGLHQKPMISAIAGWDNSLYYYWLRSAFLERPFDFRESALQTQTMPEEARLEFLNSTPTSTGRLPNKNGIGWVASSVPFYLMADGIVQGINASGWGIIPRDGYGPIYQYMIFFGQLLYAGLYLNSFSSIHSSTPEKVCNFSLRGWAIYFRTGLSALALLSAI